MLLGNARTYKGGSNFRSCSLSKTPECMSICSIGKY
jgi:hypothetical protein